MAGPTAIINKLIDRLNVTADCSNFNTLPDLGFVIGDHILSLAQLERFCLELRLQFANECL